MNNKHIITWILVADRANAQLFEHRRERGGGLKRIRTLEHPRGRLSRREINSDRNGRSFPRHGGGSSTLEKAHDPLEHEAELFAHELAAVLTDGDARRSFDDLILVAAPRLLGHVRHALKGRATDRIVRSVSKDCAEMSPAALEAEVTRMLELPEG